MSDRDSSGSLRHAISAAMPGREDCCVHRQGRADRDVLRCALLSGQACQDRWRAWLDQARGQGQAGQVGAAAAAGLVPDPVQVRADRADADEQLGGDLGVGTALGDQGDQLPLPGTERPQPGAAGCGGPGAVSIRAYSAAAARLIAAPRSSAARARPAPSTWRALRNGWSRKRKSGRVARAPLPGVHVLQPTSSGLRRAARSRRTGTRRHTGSGPAPTSRRSARRSGALRAGAPRRARNGPHARPGHHHRQHVGHG